MNTLIMPVSVFRKLFCNFCKFILLLLLILVCQPKEVKSQNCTGCTYTVSTNSSTNYTLTSGQKLCITSTGTVTGTIILNGGSICSQGNFTPGAFTYTQGNFDNYGSATFGNISFSNSSITLTNYLGATLTINGTYTASNPGASFINNGTATVTGAFSQSSGTLTNNGTLTLNSTASSGGTFTNNGTLTSHGFTITGGTFSNSVTGNIANIGNFINSGGSNSNSGTITNTGNFTSSTTFTNSGGLITCVNFINYSTFALSGGSITSTNFTNSGTINGPVSGAGCGAISATTTTTNSGSINGYADICDATPPSGSVKIDNNTGTVASTVSYCVCCVLNSATISGATPICSGSSTTLTASTGLTYSWSTTATTQAITVNPTTTTTYTVTITYTNACTKTVTKTVVVGTPTTPYGDWTGTTNTDWFNCLNWKGYVVPTSSTDVTIKNGAVNMPVISVAGAVCRNLTIESSATLTINNSASTLTIYGNYLNSNSATGSLSHTAGTITFGGASAQTINTGAGATNNSFYNLTINNSSGGVSLLSNPAIVTGALTLTNGVLTTTSTNLLTLTNGSTSSSGSINSYISGPVKKIGNTAFSFPIGKGGYFSPLSISASNTITDSYTAEYFYAGQVYGTAKDTTFDYISTCDYFVLNRNTGTSNVIPTLTVGVQSCLVNLNPAPRVIGWNGSQWNDLGLGIIALSNFGGTVQPAAALTTYGPLTFGNNTQSTTHPLDSILKIMNAGPCKALFISEYVHDTINNNNAIEIYNPTSGAINLNHYFITTTVNNSIANNPAIIPLSGTIASHSTFVIVNNNASSALKSKANMLVNNLTIYGKDIVTLEYSPATSAGIALIDKIGDLNIAYADSGWAVAGGSTKNHTLVRKPLVLRGNVDWSTCKNEWFVYARGTFNHLGNHQGLCTDVVDPNLTLSFANQQQTGSCGDRYFEFDIMASSIPNTYFDNCVIKLSYNTGAFFNNVATNGNIIITKGTAFNNSTYIDPDLYVVDDSVNVLRIPFGSDLSATSWNRTLLTSSPVQLLHIKIKIQVCNENSLIHFTDTDTTFGTANFSLYSLNAGDDPNTTFHVYNHTIYSPDLNSDLCSLSITDFNSPVNAGVGDILTISGTNFGTIREGGQVKFVNADSCCVAHIQKLNDIDYILWSDTEIKIKVPSFVDSIYGLPAIGGGDFIVTNTCGDSVVSGNAGKPFNIYYNISQTSDFFSSYEKYRVNLRSTNNNDGYTFRLNPVDFPINSNKRGIFSKAMKDWICFTGVNLQIGLDTSIVFDTNVNDGVNYVFFTSALPNATNGNTRLSRTTCSNGVASLSEVDMMFNSNSNFVYDSTGTISITSGQIDFYGTCLHEIGHAIQISHNSNPDDLMYWLANKGPLSTTQRKKLSLFTAPVDGGIFSVSQSVNNSIITGCSSWVNMIGLNALCGPNGIPDYSLADKSFGIYPNPSTGVFYLVIISKAKSFFITDILGQRIFVDNIRSEVSEIDMSKQANGVYFIHLEWPNGIESQKIVIHK